MKTRTTGIAFLVAYIATIFVANLFIRLFGVIPVGFGLMAPAAVYFAGLAFTLRDLVQESLGRVAVVSAILIGAGVSAALSPKVALASGAAFLVSELADFVIYTPLRSKNFLAAVAMSNSVGLVLDSVVFLSLAFGSLEFLPGQVVAKLYVTIASLIVLYPIRKRYGLLPRHA
jgi:uncharacterized PurR-regulated membrane protein YhhQ (DUF165 family)